MYYMLYAKGPHHEEFAPIDWKTGERKANKIRATMFSKETTERLREDLPALAEANPGWKFELRRCG